MIDQAKRDAILDKILKLHRKAEGSKEVGSLEEAAIFAAKVQELLVENDLSMIDVEASGQDVVADEKAVEIDRFKAEGQWESRLLGVISDFYFCSVIYHHYEKISDAWRKQLNRKNTATIFGSSTDITVVKFLYEMLNETFERKCRETYKELINVNRLRCMKSEEECLQGADEIYEEDEYVDCRAKAYYACFCSVEMKHVIRIKVNGTYYMTLSNPAIRHLMPFIIPFRKSFFHGAVDTITLRFREMRAKMNEKHEGYTGLVLVKDAASKNLMNKMFPDVPTRENKELKLDPNAYRAGRRSAENVVLAPAIEEKRSNLALEGRV